MHQELPQYSMPTSDNKRDVEETVLIYGGGHFPDELPPRSGPPPAATTWKQRLRGFLTFSPQSFNFFSTPDGQARIRRIVMVVILLLRSAMSALSILSAVANGFVAGIIIYSILAVLSLWFTATCLAIIGDAASNRDFVGAVIQRWHFDLFLCLCLIIHACLIVSWFFGVTGWGLEVAGVGMWLAILGVAFIAGWEPRRAGKIWST